MRGTGESSMHLLIYRLEQPVGVAAPWLWRLERGALMRSSGGAMHRHLLPLRRHLARHGGCGSADAAVMLLDHLAQGLPRRQPPFLRCGRAECAADWCCAPAHLCRRTM